MKERFKFRIWDVNKKQWEEDRVFLDNNGRLYDIVHRVRVKEETHIIQQYTGLKDRNGKLIFEGDLLRTDLKRPYNIVVFRNGMFMVECEDTDGIYYDLFCGVGDDLKKDIDRYDYEIIGNIFENKELLKEK